MKRMHLYGLYVIYLIFYSTTCLGDKPPGGQSEPIVGNYRFFGSPKADIPKSISMYLQVGLITQDIGSNTNQDGAGVFGIGGFLLDMFHLHGSANIVADDEYKTYYSATVDYVLNRDTTNAFLFGTRLDLYEYGLVTGIYYVGYTYSGTSIDITIGGGPATMHVTEALPASVGLHYFAGLEFKITQHFRFILEHSTAVYGFDPKHDEAQFQFKVGGRYFTRMFSVDMGFENEPFLKSRESGFHIFANATIYI